MTEQTPQDSSTQDSTQDVGTTDPDVVGADGEPTLTDGGPSEGALIAEAVQDVQQQGAL